ncbi:MAG: hypothetical protein HKN13_01860 [Rhodothermales bacterium]|nr:hypothetical protein [Rhodothermales bacterium]
MTSRERVIASFHSQPVDRVPLNVFAGWNPGIRAAVDSRYGHVDTFCEKFGIDIVTGVLPRFPFGDPNAESAGRSLSDYLKLEAVDPSASAILEDGCDADQNLFLSVREALKYRSQEKAVFVHAWGVFELSQFLFERNGMPGTQDALMNMIAEPELSTAMYQVLARWSAACVKNAILAGADVIELSDDWGQQDTMLFSPRHWREMIYPATKIIVDAAREQGVPVLLHSDGDITMILDGIKDLGFGGLHPVQESAGMSFSHTRGVLGADSCIMGGLDTVTTLPVMTPSEIRSEIERVFGILKDSGPFIFAGSHMFQDDTSHDVIEAAYEAAREIGSY